jgi:hypothetical protein
MQNPSEDPRFENTGPGSFGFWLACNREEVERAKRLHDAELAEIIYGIHGVIDEVGPPYSLRPASLAMRELQRLRWSPSTPAASAGLVP